MSPSADLAKKARKALEETLGIKYSVLVIGDRYTRETIKGMTPVMIDRKIIADVDSGTPKAARAGVERPGRKF